MGAEPLFDVTLACTKKLSDALSEIYVLLPVLDNDKHYWVGWDEVEKLVRHGEGWLENHPEKDLIARRYLRHQKSLTAEALSRLLVEDGTEPEVVELAHQEEEARLESKLTLNETRLDAVAAALKATGAARVLDLGCGEGKLLRALLKEKQFTEIVGLDVSHRSLEIANEKLKTDRMSDKQKARLKFLHGSLIYRDKRINGYDAAACVEVIEHLDEARLAAFERVLFEFAKPQAIVVTTPNAGFNVKFENLPAGKLRHKDHRFEWTRAQFQSWASGVAGRFGYVVAFSDIGPIDPVKLMRKLRGKDVKLTHGLQQTVDQLEPETAEFKSAVASFIDDLLSHYVLDAGNLVVAHAGLKETMQGRGSGAVRSFALFGETTGETDEYGLPVRHNWAAEYRGKATVVYGHTPVPEAEWLNNTICIDTGCVYGGKLTALRYPERDIVQVEALQMYCEPAKPLHAPDAASTLSAQQQLDDVLDIEDTIGKRIVSTRIHHNVTIREENATAALEVMSRFAANPKWLIYLPPTMSPTETTKRVGLLEHPEEAFAYYRKMGVEEVVCEEKHMGSRAVVVLCRDQAVAAKRFGISENEFGIAGR